MGAADTGSDGEVSAHIGRRSGETGVRGAGSSAGEQGVSCAGYSFISKLKVCEMM